MNNRQCISLFFFAFLVLSCSHPATCQEPLVLQNEFLRAEFSGRGLSTLEDRRTGYRIRLTGETFALSLSGTEWSQAGLTAGNTTVDRDSLVFVYSSNLYTVTVLYGLKPEWRFLTKRIIVEPASPAAEFRVNRIDAFQARLDTPPLAEQPLPPPPSRSSGSWGTLLRFPGNEAK